MGRGVKAGPEAGGPEHCIQHRADGTLPVRAGHMEKAQTLSGIPQGLEEALDILEPELDSELLRLIKPRQRFLVSHFRDGPR